jgi:hypothetical protein
MLRLYHLFQGKKSLTTFYKTSKKGDFYFCSVDSEKAYIIHGSNFKNLTSLSSSSLFSGLLKSKMSADDILHDASNVYCNLMCYCLFLYRCHEGFRFQMYLLMFKACIQCSFCWRTLAYIIGVPDAIWLAFRPHFTFFYLISAAMSAILQMYTK